MVLRRVGVAGLVMGTVFLVGGPAWAHVTISPDSAPKGTDAVLAFNVPDESETLDTTQVAIFFPAEHPIADALIEPIPGWTAAVATEKVSKPIKTDTGSVTDRVKSVTWTGGKIGPGDFQQFVVSVGLPADANSLVFKALQTYSDGSITHWIETTSASGAEPEHPAPVLTLTAGSDTSTATTTTPSSGSGSGSGNVATKSDVDSAKTTGIIGVVLGALGLVVAIGAFAAGRKRQAPARS